MTFVTITFFLFLAVAFLCYFVMPKQHRWLVLLAFSIAFYLFAGWEKFLFVLASALIAYLVGRKGTKSSLVLGIVSIVLLLFYAKAGNSILAAFQMKESIIVPLGISYYSFSVIGYMLDVYYKKIECEKNFFAFLLYMIYFPQILEGPIPRYKKLAPQLMEGHEFSYERFCFGAQRALWGYFKKLVIADRIALYTGEVFSNYKEYSGIYFFVAVLLSSLQLYADFSGCMDIALGVSQCFGISLDENFRRPFFSKNAAEFWRRWHITLGTWFKDYVYMHLAIHPKLLKLSKLAKDKVDKRFGKSLITIIPLTVVWLLTGLWHGTGADYILWGCYWGIIIILSTVFAKEWKQVNQFLKIDVKSKGFSRFQMIRTFFVFSGARLLTAPGDLKVSAYMFRHMFSLWSFNEFFTKGALVGILSVWDVVIVIVGTLILWKVDLLQEQGVEIRKKIGQYPILLRWVFYYGLFFATLVFGIYGPGYQASDFVYIQF